MKKCFIKDKGHKGTVLLCSQNSNLETYGSSPMYHIKKTVLFGTIFYFALCSVMLDFVIIFINQITYKHKLIPLIFKTFKDVRQCRGCMVGVIMKKNYRAIFYLTCNSLTNTVWRGIVFPVKWINIRYKSNILIRDCANCINTV